MKLGNKDSIFNSILPVYDASKIKVNTVNVVLQVNGKIKDHMDVSSGLSEKELEKLAFENDKVKHSVQGKSIVKVIAVKNKLVNIVVK